jgi:hypothetical protein
MPVSTFRRNTLLRLRGKTNRASAVEMEALSSSETFVSTYKSMRCTSQNTTIWTVIAMKTQAKPWESDSRSSTEQVPRMLCNMAVHSRRDPSRWPRDTLYPQKLELTTSISGGRSVGIVRSRIQATELSYSRVRKSLLYLRAVEPGLRVWGRLKCTSDIDPLNNLK